MVITAAECDAILSRDLAKFEDAVNAALRTPIGQNKLSQNAFDACVSLAFNIGAPGFTGSTVVRDVNDDDMQAAADAFLMWEQPPELRGRREGERAQFLRPDSGAPAGAANPEAPRGSIAWVQMRLNAAGANPQLDLDGDLGPATSAAIKAFQTSHGLLADGIAGPQTLAALDAAGVNGAKLTAQGSPPRRWRGGCGSVGHQCGRRSGGTYRSAKGPERARRTYGRTNGPERARRDLQADQRARVGPEDPGDLNSTASLTLKQEA